MGLRLQPQLGLLNNALDTVGAHRLSTGWLSGDSTAMPAVIATANWTYFGFAMVIFLAGLQSIDPQLYESATLDGAGAWARFQHVTIPGLRAQITLLLVVSFINTLRTFDLVYVMTSGATRLAGAHGVLSIIGYHNAGGRSVDMQAWNWKALTVVNAHVRDRHRLADATRSAMQLLASGRLNIDAMITHRYPLDQINDAYHALHDKPAGFVKAVLDL